MRAIEHRRDMFTSGIDVRARISHLDEHREIPARHLKRHCRAVYGSRREVSIASAGKAAGWSLGDQHAPLPRARGVGTAKGKCECWAGSANVCAGATGRVRIQKERIKSRPPHRATT